MSPPIHHTFGPLADRRQRSLAWWWLLHWWQWRTDAPVTAMENALEERFGANAVCFASGREALVAYLRSLALGPGDEVIVQGYTCVVVPNAVHAAGGTVIYADIDPQTLNLDVQDVERRITQRTRAILCQHTFGIPANTERLRQLCDRHHLALIEDCAHILPDDQGPDAIGRLGDALLLSFGLDKAVSGVGGGAIIVRNPERAQSVRGEQERAQRLSFITIKRLLLYPILYGWARPLYGIGIGKVLLRAAQLLRLLPPILHTQEKHGTMRQTLHRIAPPCAALAHDQLQNLRVINDHRRARTLQYLQACKDRGWQVIDGITPDLPLQKFPLFIEHPDALRQQLKRRNIHLDDGWTSCVICPRSVDAEQTGYTNGCDPSAERVARGILSLPTHPGTAQRDVLRLLEALDALPHFSPSLP